MNLRLVFLNCYNLFPPEMLVDRPGAPHTQEAAEAKLQGLAETIRKVFSGEVPELIALSEIGSELSGRRLARALDVGAYRTIWSGIPRNPIPQTGLMVLYKPDVLGVIAAARVGPPSAKERRKWLAVRLHLLDGSKADFWLVVNHWKSQMNDWNSLPISSRSHLPSRAEGLRLGSAQEIGELYLDQEHRSTRAMVLVGDFNCEPWERPWKGLPPNRLVGARERSVVLRKGNSKAYFYNPMWRFLGEPDDHETASRDDYQPPRLMGTFVGVENKAVSLPLWDQMLVSKGMLKGSGVRFREASLVIVRPQAGFTDHCAIGASFEY